MLRLLLAAFAVFVTSPALAALSTDSIAAEIALEADGKVTLSYPVAEGAPRTLRFANTSLDFHQVVRSPGWKLDERCFTLAQGWLTIAPDDACAKARIVLEWEDRPRDRIYPAVVHLRNGGVLVFAGYPQVLTADGERVAPILLVAPPGGVAVFRDRKSSTALTVDGETFKHDGRGWFYLGPDNFVEGDVARMLVDDGVPASARAQVLDLAPRLLRFYGERLGKIPQRPVFYLTWSAREDPAENWQADVVSGEARFGLRGRGWAMDPPQRIAPFRDAVAHELAHFWNGWIHHPAFGTPWLSEGTAELFAAAGLLHEGVIDAEAAAGKLEAATTECLLMAGSRSWLDFPSRDRGRAPYACGFAMQFAIVAASRAGESSFDPFSLWSGIWQEWPHYYEASVAKFFQRHGDPALADLLQDMLTRKDLPLETALKKLLARGKIAVAARRPISGATVSMAGGAVVGAMMAADCNRSYSLYRQADYVAIGEVPCKTFRPGMRIAFVAGHDLFTEPFAASTDARKACIEGRPVTLKTRDGDAIDVPCASYTAAELPSDAALMQFDPADVKRVMLGP